MFEADFERLARVQRVLRWSRWIAAALVLACIAGALVLWPGPYARGLAFNDVQIHLELSQYFSHLGVQTSQHDDEIVLGMRFEQFHAFLRLISIIPAILAIAGIFRMRWRETLSYGAIWFVLTGIPNAIEEKHGAEVAIPQEFGVRPVGVMFAAPPVGSQPAGAVTPTGHSGDVGSPSLTPSGLYPLNRNFGALQKQLGGAPASPIEQARQYIARQPAERLARAAKIRAEFASGMSDLSTSQKAAMHYTAAEVSYLEQDRGATREQLNAISRTDFNPTYDADYRIRRMQEWVESNGKSLSPSSYRPITGWPLSLIRLAAKLLALMGIVAFFGYGALLRLGRRLSARLQRMGRMADELAEIGTQSLRPDLADPEKPVNFGERAGRLSPQLETETSV